MDGELLELDSVDDRVGVFGREGDLSEPTRHEFEPHVLDDQAHLLVERLAERHVGDAVCKLENAELVSDEAPLGVFENKHAVDCAGQKQLQATGDLKTVEKSAEGLADLGLAFGFQNGLFDEPFLVRSPSSQCRSQSSCLGT